MIMRTIAIEEHFSTSRAAPAGADQYMAEVGKKLADLDDARIADMDAAKIDVQVLSLSAVVGDALDAAGKTARARDANDYLAAAIKRHPRRFAGFGALALEDPDAAASELGRCITKLGFVGAMVDGTIDGQFLDNPRFQPVLAEAERLGAPLYLHPAPPPAAVIKAYYSGLPESVAFPLSIAGWGWHAEMGLHSLRLVVSGVFDRFPRLQVIIGHMGEFIPYCIARSDLLLSRAATHLQRRVSDYYRTNFHFTTSGYFTIPPLLCALMVFGPERIIFAVDYPYSPNAAGRA
ncbi:MAG TPA: amidohydrolase family protein, partial [bacterium]|nr:amidohydrolase family protein [bacterium]